ncbi:kunitz-type trypsin inhibitor-like 2 protein-like precursor [Cicer arietinum]|uniref:Kunitz-type trypsin inhibitor-like 2 protein-like precursor n=2 Tax=Cicer arietinum TaxID=3827 RepID=Q9M3Z7_CICAR|nr:kunitz-type trypsin inhibitor-like 2 protein-like precursor [Cicer arietinum]CAB76907.3 trypsin protein inhibitor 2 [Cicer arietinum]
MKQSFTLSFLLFVFLLNLSLAFSNEDVEQVLDINGNPIFPGGKYYILPAIRGPPGGGVRLDKTGDSECPVTVLQDYKEVINGLPVKFVIPGISPGIIFTGTPIEIEFTKKPNCAESSKWLIFVDDTIDKACIGIGGPENYSGKQTLSGTFNIQKYGSGFGYKLGFCVKGSPICLDIGRYDNDEGGRRLNLTEHEAFRVVFVDASSYEDGIVKSVV